MHLPPIGVLLLVLALLLPACNAPPPAPPTPGGGVAATTASPTAAGPPPSTPTPFVRSAASGTGANRNLVIGVRYEPPTLLDKVLVNASTDATWRLFNATFAMTDSQGNIVPYLVDQLPQLGTDSWKILPDGQMDTTYKLKPGLTWHDGRPLTSQDFTFALLLYATQPLTQFEQTGHERIIGFSSPDPLTVVIRWATPYMDAGTLRARKFTPLPRHILEQLWVQLFASQQEVPEATAIFMRAPYWTTGYVGAGPYRLTRWVPGSHLEAEAFEGHALGRPRIDRVTVRFIPDENAMLSSLLAGEIDLATDNSLRFEQAQVLKREWEATGKGTVLQDAIQPRLATFQVRPEFANPTAFLDVRVRRALSHALDRTALADALFQGQVPPSDQLMPRSVPYFADLDRSVRKYPFDLRQTEQLLGEAGYRRGADGAYANAAGARLAFESLALAGTQNEREGTLLVESLQRAGLGATGRVLPLARAYDVEARATFPGLAQVATPVGEQALESFSTLQIPAPINRWTGLNRGGWDNAMYAALWDQFNGTLDRNERNRQIVQLMQLVTEDAAALFLYHSPVVTAFATGLRGPALGVPDRLPHWNVFDWEYY